MTGFEKRPAWSLWVELVSKDIKKQATPGEAKRLREPANLVDWLRALNCLQAETEARMGDARLRLDALKPKQRDAALSEEYLAAKRDHDLRHATRVRFCGALRTRRDECLFLIDRTGIDQHATVSALVQRMARVEQLLIDDEVDSALECLQQGLDYVEDLIEEAS